MINGDGSHSRDFTFVDNAVNANIPALFTENTAALNQVYNIACGEQTSLLQLFQYLREAAGTDLQPTHGPERKGDVRHSLADISKAKNPGLRSKSKCAGWIEKDIRMVQGS